VNVVKEDFFAAGTDLIKGEEEVNKVFILVEGTAESYFKVNNEVTIIDSELEPGTVIGQMSVLMRNQSMFSVRAKTDAYFFTISAESIDNLRGFLIDLENFIGNITEQLEKEGMPYLDY